MNDREDQYETAGEDSMDLRDSGLKGRSPAATRAKEDLREDLEVPGAEAEDKADVPSVTYSPIRHFIRRDAFSGDRTAAMRGTFKRTSLFYDPFEFEKEQEVKKFEVHNANGSFACPVKCDVCLRQLETKYSKLDYDMIH